VSYDSGATGNSGLQVIQQAIERGHSVKALVRTPHKVEMQHQNLKVLVYSFSFILFY